MATFKHISSKNADYGAAEQYLTFAHDEFTMKPTLDGNGHLVPREDYRISALNCGSEDFAIACMRANLRYGKNQARSDVKSHHYIISFDPRDGAENGLTIDRAQALGMEFAAAQFPGHQALVCTHPDGDNRSGNIHVHIVINSLRIEAVPMLPYMDRPADTKAGCKHRCTDAAMEYFKSEVMELCHREQLYQIDLLNGSKNRVTEREYWAAKKGQLALDRENAFLTDKGLPTKPTKFETDKEKLRCTLRAALSAADSFDEYAALLLQQGITVKESRGRLSYLTPDRTKPITARKLGDDFDRAAVLACLAQTAQRGISQNAKAPAGTIQNGKPLTGWQQAERTVIPPQREGWHVPSSMQPPTIQRMVDREAARQKGVGYDRWASVFNLKQMAKAQIFLEENGMLDFTRLDAAILDSKAAYDAALSAVKSCETELSQKKQLRTAVLKYLHTKPAVSAYYKLKPKQQAAYRKEHDSEFILYEAAKKQLAELAPGRKLPSAKNLNAEIESLISEKNALYTEYHEKKKSYSELQAIRDSAQSLHGIHRPREQENER